jgi:hypothetical protein
MFKRQIQTRIGLFIALGLIGSWLLFVRDPDNQDETTLGGLLMVLGFLIFVTSAVGLLVLLIRTTQD